MTEKERTAKTTNNRQRNNSDTNQVISTERAKKEIQKDTRKARERAEREQDSSDERIQQLYVKTSDKRYTEKSNYNVGKVRNLIKAEVTRVEILQVLTKNE